MRWWTVLVAGGGTTNHQRPFHNLRSKFFISALQQSGCVWSAHSPLAIIQQWLIIICSPQKHKLRCWDIINSTADTADQWPQIRAWFHSAVLKKVVVMLPYRFYRNIQVGRVKSVGLIRQATKLHKGNQIRLQCCRIIGWLCCLYKEQKSTAYF